MCIVTIIPWECHFCLFVFVFVVYLFCGTRALSILDGKNEVGYFMAILFLVEYFILILSKTHGTVGVVDRRG